MYIFSRIKTALMKPIVSLVKKPSPLTYIGAGKVLEVAKLLQMNGSKKAAVLTGKSLLKSGLLNPMLEEMKKNNIDVVLCSGITPDPTFELVAAVQEQCGECDAIVAVGGGSVLDTAKAVAAAAANHIPAVKLAGMLKVKRRPLLLIAVPTTAGTGSETTVAAIISDGATHAKKQILDPKIVPFAAILDPVLTAELPLKTTAFTVMDALTHALEAIVSGYATEETDRYGQIAVKLIYENLAKVMQNPADLEGREALLVASYFAGMAFTRTYVGYVHAFSHTIGGKFSVSHGLANAILLPHVMQSYLPLCGEQFATLADLVSLPAVKGASQSEKAKRFVDSLFDLNSRFDIPKRFENFPASAIDEVVSVAFKECHGTYPVPKYFSKTEAVALLKKVCSEDKPIHS